MVKKWMKENPSGIHVLFYIIFALVLFLIIAYQSVTIIQLGIELSEAKEKIFDLENEIDYLTQKSEAQITKFNIEQKARELGMVYNGEKIIEITECKDNNLEEKTHLQKTIIYLNDWYDFIKTQWYNLF